MRNYNTIILKMSLLLVMTIGAISHTQAQKFVSLVGVKAGHNSIALSGKIALAEKDYVEGTFGLFTGDPVAFGPSVAYHRHFMLSENQNTQLYIGPNIKGAVGDASSMGFGVDLGLTYLYKNVNIGVEANPSYFLNEVFEFQPLYGIHLRWVNY